MFIECESHDTVNPDPVNGPIFLTDAFAFISIFAITITITITFTITNITKTRMMKTVNQPTKTVKIG